MISVTKMNNDPIMLNADLIETVASRPDTIITLTTGNKIMVKESVEEVVERVIEYRKQINIAAIEKSVSITEENKD